MKGHEHATRNSRRHRSQTTEPMLMRAQEQLQVSISQFNSAVKEIERAQPEIHALDKARSEAGDSARRAKETSKGSSIGGEDSGRYTTGMERRQ